MSAKKILILPLCLSVAGHLAILLTTGIIDDMPVRENSETVFTVDLKKVLEEPRSGKEGKKRPRIPAHTRLHARDIAANSVPRESYDADTVDLGDTDSRYTPYLKQLRLRIEKIWIYPEGASARKEEGVTVIRFSVAKNGGLEKIDLIASSGSPLLDEGTIRVIKAAAPYEPLPATFNISRLNIVAAFRYRIAE
ncbi:MAG: energy transducer TonB [Deltaproteobacteria bacterium]|nr:energy transducer TonB [Deltaproteobacteria bacterium]